MATTLRSASLPEPRLRRGGPDQLVCAVRQPGPHVADARVRLHYDDGREIRDQIVDLDTMQDAAAADGLRHWKEAGGTGIEARFYSIRSFPERFALWQMGALIGDLMQPALQYNAPVPDDHGGPRAGSRTRPEPVGHGQSRARHPERQQQDGQVMPDVGKKLQDWTAAADAIDAGRRDRQHVPPARALHARRSEAVAAAGDRQGDLARRGASSSTTTSTCTARR